ncbi:MAG TPA: ABC transporter ATP-binding protein [Firmicutes bacterium]|nr:ABC transporter ATP-binding protein [Bacillota bacterium]
MQKAIEVKNVTLAYSQDCPPELEGVNLSVAKGEFLCLVGPSGCGKSTLLRLIAGVLTPDQGEIKVFGDPKTAGWSRLSFVPQDSLLLPWRTVLDNLLLPLELNDPASGRSVWEEQARAALHLVNLDGVEDKYPHQLSGGMRQRVALARALVGRAELLLLDEPFAALDAMTRSQLHLEIMGIRQKAPFTGLMVTHNIFEAVFLADRVLVMGEKPGRILGEVKIDLAYPRALKIMSTPEFAALVGAVQELLEKGWGKNHV